MNLQFPVKLAMFLATLLLTCPDECAAEIIFEEGSTYAVGVKPYDLTFLDINGDNSIDIVTTNAESNDITILINDGAGGYDSSITYSVGQRPRSVCAGDFDHNGWPDIAVVCQNTRELMILLNDGAGGLLLDSSISLVLCHACIVV